MVLLSMSVLIFTACEEDPLANEQTATVQFQIPQTEVAENADASSIILQLSKPAPEGGFLTLKTDDKFDELLTSEPPAEGGFINIPVGEGTASVTVKVTPKDNLIKTGDGVATISLHQLPGRFRAGVNSSLSITVKDDEVSDPKSVANFIPLEAILEETNSTGIEYQIHLSEELTAPGEVKLSLVSDDAIYDTHYVTEPAAQEGQIILAAGAGQKVISFRVKPIDNSEITGELHLKFVIAETSGPIWKGEKLEQTLAIKDEELSGKPKGYEITTSFATAKRFYEYDQKGRIAKVQWENFTSFVTRGTETYFYDENDRVTKINHHAFRDEFFYWEGDRITKSEEVVDGQVTSYSEYDYDEAGNIGAVATYYRQDNGAFLQGFFTIYLYFLDGNLYKSMTYQPGDNPEEPNLLRTRTYDNYVNVPNPFQMEEIVPGIKAQTKLATTYRVEENGVDLTYTMNYEYLPDGQPGKRVATATGDTQTAVYHYY